MRGTAERESVTSSRQTLIIPLLSSLTCVSSSHQGSRPLTPRTALVLQIPLRFLSLLGSPSVTVSDRLDVPDVSSLPVSD
jgi:hypothetical protein